MGRCEEEREYLKKQQAEVEHKLEVVCKTEADAKAEAKHAQLRYEDRDHELDERAALLRRQEAEQVMQPRTKSHCRHVWADTSVQHSQLNVAHTTAVQEAHL